MKLLPILLLGVSLTALAQECRQAAVISDVRATQTYSQEIGSRLEFRLTPVTRNWGWVISISPEGSNEDWTFPATLPLRTGESQVLGTGYGSTARDKLKYAHRVRFLLTEPDYRKYFALATQTLESPRREAAGEYISLMQRMSVGYVTLEALDYDKSGSPETAEWMRFKASFVVPKSFQSTDTLSWSTADCPGPE